MRHASLFSGIGGPEVAAAMMGWENAFHCEINPFGRAVLDYWFPKSKSYEDITKTDFREWRGKIDILSGGFPCQPFSYAGNRGGQKDARYLWPEMLRAIDEIRPSWVVGENVAGITTMVEGGVLADLGSEETLFPQGAGVHRYELQQTFTIERICRDLEHIGYSVQPMLIPAAAVGAPHRRDRVFIIAYAPNSNDNSTLRGSEKHEGESQKEWLSERDEIQQSGEPSNVRQTPDGFTSDSAGKRRGEVLQHLQPKLANGAEPLGLSRLRSSSDTPFLQFYGGESGMPWNCRKSESEPGSGNCKDDASHTKIQQGGFRPQQSQYSSAQQGQLGRGSSSDGDGLLLGLLPENRWRCFPTVSPVHRGNDGIPFRLDDLTISQSKWRTESLKAYGNAIVPQVMYRIFQAIEVAS